METPPAKPIHLAVLIHGLWGNPSHLKQVATSLQEKYNDDRLHILVAKSNADSFTYDGVEVGGERVTHEIEDEIRQLEDKGFTVEKISVVGYSFGGLIARYSIGLLYAAGMFDRIQPVNFTTFATPHLGVPAPLIGKASRLWNAVGSRTLSTSGRQLFLIDNYRDSGRPVLAILADPTSTFIRALASFKHRSLYANIVNDRTVVYYTGAIERTDPFVDMSSVEFNTVPGTEGVLLDPEHPVRRKIPVKLSLMERFQLGAKYHLSSIPFYILLTAFLPFGALFFLTSAGIQSFRSASRIQQHESGKTNVVIDRYRKEPFLLGELRNVADRLYQHGEAAKGEEFLPTPPSEENEQQKFMGHSTTRHAETLVGQEAGVPAKTADSSVATEEAFPVLALTKDQFNMIDALDDVGFTKYRVHITKVRHSHAAIVVRIPWRPGFGEGRIVLKHWADNFEI